MKSFLIVFLGGGIGASTRYFLNTLLQNNVKLFGIPTGTLAVNIIGSFFIGAAMAILLNQPTWQNYKLFFITGFLGALTTFSTFSFETIDLLNKQDYSHAILNVLINNSTCLFVTALSFYSIQLFQKG